LLGISGTAQADIFKYTDKHGRVYLTDRPEHKGYKLLVKTTKGWVDRYAQLRMKMMRNRQVLNNLMASNGWGRGQIANASGTRSVSLSNRVALASRGDREVVNYHRNRGAYAPYIARLAQMYQLPESLLHAVIMTESAYNPGAVSRAGAVGMMQLMPGTAARYGVADRRDPLQNMQGGAAYLRDLLNMFQNNVALALAGYNAGENAVIKYGYQVPPYYETRNYVSTVMQYYHQYNQLSQL
jgi:soluble lytic murein transglycosylase-like protein